MGYITEFGERLAELLYGIPEEQRRAILGFVKNELMKSYKNGFQDAAHDIKALCKQGAICKRRKREDDKRPARR